MPSQPEAEARQNTLDAVQEINARADAGDNVTPAEETTSENGGLNPNALPPQADFDILPVVGLGGSAGSIGVLRQFFGRIAPDTGLAFVVVVHLSPDYESQLATILRAQTKMTVVTVSETVKVEPDTVYVIPPGHHLRMEDGTIGLAEVENEFGKRVAVDLFFRTLAASCRSRAVAVVLSGVDSDGAIGIKRIKEHGGVTVAQDPGEAEYEGMPRAAIQTGMVDWVLPAAQIASRLEEFARNEPQIQLPSAEVETRVVDKASADEDEVALREVLAFLHARTRHDFAHYKRATVLRRIGRRLQVNSLSSLPRYLDFLRTHAGESGALLQDLLISVTNFFRDPESFAILETHIPALFRGKTSGDQVRVWVTGCATGEEAYSMAMLLIEHADTLPSPPTIQIFATDIDDEALRTAREGRYPQAIATDVSPERLRRFFQLDQGMYRVRADVRDRVLFAAHNLLRDAPFSRMDLISCRNLLIYFQPDAQEKAFTVFHFALLPEAMLFLGGSEAPDETTGLFAALDKKHRLYTRRLVTRPTLHIPSLPISAPLLPPQLSRTSIASVPVARPLPSTDLPVPAPSFGEMHLQLLELLAPPSVLVNDDYDILHLSPRAGRFLRFAGGSVSTNLLSVVHPSLRLELRAALFRAAQNGEDVDAGGVPVELESGWRLVDIRVRPLREPERPDAPIYSLLVVFDDHAPEDVGGAPVVARAEEDGVAQRLDREIGHLKGHLRSTVEQYEATTEELKASNEELQALNEELRSAGEELETSREELQATNEELLTVNAEMKSKVEETSRANSDLQNLMAATQIATLFLDRSLRIQRYTPPTVELFNLIPTDTGRPVGDLRLRLRYDNLADDARRVLDSLVPIEREVQSDDGRWFLARVQPYRTIEDRISGVVLTFVDISERRRAEEARRQSEERMRLLVESAKDYAIFTLDSERRVTGWNSGAELILGYSKAEILGQLGDIVFTPGDRAEGVPQNETQTALDEGRATNERFHQRKDGSRFFGSGVTTTLGGDDGQVRGFVKIMRDLTEQRRAQEAVRESEEKYRSLFDSMDEGYCILQMLYDEAGQPFNFRYVEVNPAFEKQTGFHNATGKTIREFAPDIEPKWMEIYGRVAETGESIRFEEDSPTLDGRAFDLYAFRVGDAGERKIAVLFTDISERKQAETALAESEKRYRSLFNSMEQAYCVFQILYEDGAPVNWRYEAANPAFEEQTGMYNALGRTIMDFAPDIERKWFEVYARVAETGESTQFEESSLAFGGDTFYCYAFSLGRLEEHKVAVLFTNITERKRREQNLTFLADIENRFAGLTSSEEIAKIAAASIGDHFGVSHCLLVDINDEMSVASVFLDHRASEELPSLLGDYELANFHSPAEIEQLAAGQAVVVNGVLGERSPPDSGEKFDALGTRAILTAPYVRQGRWKFAIGAQNAAPRVWREDEIAFLTELSTRVALRLERARAEELVRQSDERTRIQKEAFGSAVNNEPLALSLRTLNQIVKAQLGEDVRTAFYLAYPNGASLHAIEGAGDMPATYTNAADGFPVAEESFCSGLAIATGRPVQARDVFADPLWQEFLPLASAHNVRACASFPILTSEGQAVGAFSLYFSDVHDATPQDFAVADAVTQAAEIILSRHTEALERARAEEELREADERFRTMADTAPVLIWETDASGVIFTNGQYLDFFGADFETIRGQGWANFLHPDDAATYLVVYEQAFAKREPYTHECRFRRADGKYRWLLNTGQPLNEVHFVGSSSDITDLKLAGEAVREGEARLQALISNLPGGAAFILDRELRYTLAEGEALARVGMRSSDFVGRLFSDAMSLELAQRSEPLLRGLLEGQPFEEERELGSHTFLSRGVPLRDGNGEVTNGLVVSYDISERKRAEELARESEERLRIAVDAAEMGTWTWDIERDEAFWNERHFTLFGMEPHSNPIPSSVFLDHILDDDRDFVTARLQRAIETNTTFEIEFRIVREDNAEVRWMSGYGHGVDLVDGRVVRMSGVMLDVTERKRAEDAVRESQARLQLVVESASDHAIITQDTGGIITAWNSGAEQILGWTRDEAIGQPIALIFTPEDEASGASQLEMRTARDEGRAADERWHIRNDGRRLFMSGVLTPLCDGDETTGYVKVARDLTREQAAEAAVRQSEARFRTLSDAVPQIIWTNEAGGVANYFNSRWFEYSDLSLTDSFGPGWQAIVHPDDAPASKERWQEALDCGETFDTEYRLRGRDGQYRWFIGRNVPLKDDAGQVTGWFGTATDIHDLKVAEATLRENSERFRAMFDQGTAGVAEYDLDGQHIFVNGMFADSLVYSVQELLGLGLKDIVHPEDLPVCLEVFERAKAQTGSFLGEKRLICKDGEIIWIAESVSGIRDADGQTQSVVAVCIDMTQRKRAEDESQRAHGELEVRVDRRTRELALALEQVSAEVTQRRQAEAGRAELMKRIVNTQEEERGRISRELHDNLGQHLTAVMLGLQALETQIGSLAGGKRAQNAPQLDNLRGLVDGLMRAAHRQAWELRPAELDAMGLESALGQYTRDWSAQSGVPADFQAVGWENRPTSEVETTLYRVVQEALTNVARHAGAGQVSVVIERGHNTASAIIEDDGQGFDAENQDTGRLGVLGMRERLALVGGSLEIESEPGGGTTVFARVPLRVAGEKEAAH